MPYFIPVLRFFSSPKLNLFRDSYVFVFFSLFYDIAFMIFKYILTQYLCNSIMLITLNANFFWMFNIYYLLYFYILIYIYIYINIIVLKYIFLIIVFFFIS